MQAKRTIVSLVQNLKKIMIFQAFQWIFCERAISRPCKEIFSQIVQVIYCLP